MNKIRAMQQLFSVVDRHIEKCSACRSIFAEILFHAQTDDDLLGDLDEVMTNTDGLTPQEPCTEEEYIEGLKEFNDKHGKA